MCFLALLYKVVGDWPVVAAANRDEFLDRGGTDPAALADGVVAGTDPRAGGTWLGVAQGRRLVAVANVAGRPPDPAARSRGRLCLDLLRAPPAEPIARLIRDAVERHRYNDFNLVVAEADAAWSATLVAGRLALRRLGPGVHVVANCAPDGPDEPKVARARGLIRPAGDVDATLANLADVCRDHGARVDRADAVCVHADDRGTLSSALIALHAADPRLNRYFYARGHPCRGNYADLSELIRG